MMYQCEECRYAWTSQQAANECAILDAAEERNARRPSPKFTIPLDRWEND